MEDKDRALSLREACDCTFDGCYTGIVFVKRITLITFIIGQYGRQFLRTNLPAAFLQGRE